MSKRLVYVIGIPGSGKTTAMKGALAWLNWRAYGLNLTGFSREYYVKPGASGKTVAIQLGRSRDLMGGTDALSMSAGPKVIEWLKNQTEANLVLGEGDRLAYDKFFEEVEKNYKLNVVWLRVPEDVALQRATERGSSQNSVWLKGRITKVNHIGNDWSTEHIDGTMPSEKVSRVLAEIISNE